jgi:hypothetical protein
MNSTQFTDNAPLQPQLLLAGTARCEITNEDPGARVSDPLYAKALVLFDGKQKFVLLTVDAVSIGEICDINDDYLPQLRARLSDELGIVPENVLVNASHTHPPGRILCPDDELMERTFNVIKEATQNMVEVVAGSGTGHEDRISMNRNLQLKNGKQWTIRHANPCPPEEEVVGVGPLDPEIGVLRFDRLDGTPLAVVYNFACHMLFGDTHGSITANFIGVTSNLLETAMGHNALAFFIQGAAGDVIDVGFKNLNQPRDIESYGLKLAQSVLAAYHTIETGPVTLSVVNKTVDLPRRTDIPQRIANLKKQQAEMLTSLRFNTLNFKSFLPLYLEQKLDAEHSLNYGYAYLQDEKMGRDTHSAMDAFNRERIDTYLHGIKTMEALALMEDDIGTLERHQAINDAAGSPVAPAEFLGVRIGNCVFVSAPIEILTQVGLDVKNSSPYEHTFIAAFSNGYMHYGPPAADYDKGNYEVTECFLAPEWEQIYKATVSEIIEAL